MSDFLFSPQYDCPDQLARELTPAEVEALLASADVDTEFASLIGGRHV